MNPKVSLGEDPVLLEFRYVNWRDEEHHYTISMENIEFGPYSSRGVMSQDESKAIWVMNGFVYKRDGDSRVEQGGAPRRTFIMSKMWEVNVV